MRRSDVRLESAETGRSPEHLVASGPPVSMRTGARGVEKEYGFLRWAAARTVAPTRYRAAYIVPLHLRDNGEDMCVRHDAWRRCECSGGVPPPNGACLKPTLLCWSPP